MPNAPIAIIAVTSVMVAIVVSLTSIWMGVPPLALFLLIALQAGLVGLAHVALLRPSRSTNARLFKYASIYMLSCMVLFAANIL